MRNDSTVSANQSPYAGGTVRPGDRIVWSALLIRMFVVVLPAQLLGFFLGGAIITATGLLATRPDSSRLIDVIAGILSGLAVGLALTPKARHLIAYLVTSAGFGLIMVVLLTTLGQLKLGAAADPDLPNLAIGALLTAGPQTLVAWGLWVFKRSS